MFTDISDRIAKNPPSLHGGVAVLDVDGDGQDEIFIAGRDGPNRILKWLGGQLRDIAPRTLADPNRCTLGAAAGDLNGDGREELYVVNATPEHGPKQVPDRLFTVQPDESWEDLFSRPENRLLRNIVSGQSVAVIDRRGTGRYGFFVTNYGQPMRLYELGTEARLIDLAPPLGLNRIVGGRGVWAGPLVSERADLFCANEHGPNLLFKNLGDGRFAEVAKDVHLADEAENARGVTVLDANRDGRFDVCFGNWHGPHRLRTRGVNGCFREMATPAMALPSAIRNVIAADFDNDGAEELFFHNHDEPNRLFGRRADDWRLLDAGAATDSFGLATGAVAADVDGDGVLELLLSCGETTGQPLRLFKPATRNCSWIRVIPRTRFGAPARGAVVKLVVEGRTFVRIIDGGSSYQCQMEPVAHFGLGDADSVEKLTVTWPDGVSLSRVALPAVCRVIEVPYPES